MSNNKTGKRNWKEQRRFHALKLKKSGWKQSEIAIALKVSKGTVSQWLRKARAQGEQSLQLLSPPGRPAELVESQKRMIPDLLSHGAETYGFRGDVWTCRRVKKVIEWEFGVSYHRSHVARLLKELGWTPQQPI